jgi:hypothetical protein
VFLASSGSDFQPLLNGSREPVPRTVRAGAELRVRAINITFQNASLRYRLVTADGAPVLWDMVAKDGADLPAHHRRRLHADQVVSIGETYDFLYTPEGPMRLVLEIRSFGGTLFASQVLEVVPG